MEKQPRKNLIDVQYSLERNLKELRLLHEVARITGATEITLDERLQIIAEILPQGFNRLEEYWARITNGNKEYHSENFTGEGRIISVNIVIQGEKAGTVEVGTAGISSMSPAGQETLLVEAVAERLETVIGYSRAQEALKESEEKFSTAFRLSPAVIVIASLEGERIIEVNDNFTKLTGYTREEALQLTAVEAAGWNNDEDYQKTVAKIKKSGSIRNIEATVTTKNGEKRTILISADLVHFSGRPCILTVIQDISEFRQNRELLDSVSAASPLGIYVIQQNILQYTNPQFQELTGYNQEELVGMELLDFVAGADKDVVRASTLQTIKRKKPYPCEYRILHKSGRVKWVMQIVAPIHYNNREAVLGSLMDITERKYLERKITEYEELEKMKAGILAKVSHELRTPLAAIKGYATMMLDHRGRIKTDEAMEYLISINSSADKLINLVDNLLDTSRLDSGMLELKQSPASISALVKSVVKTASIRIDSHPIKAILPPSLPWLNIDKKRITQVLENLIFNAAGNSPAGAEIHVSASRAGRNIEIRVTDYGPAIPANELKSIFDRMYKIENREYGGTDGMGLGLHICQRLIEAHGGRIRAESQPGKGNSIRFTLPIHYRDKRGKQKSGQNQP